MLQVEERPPKQGERILCRHPFISSKRAYVQPAFVERLHKLVWDGSARGVCMNADLGLMASRLRCILTIKSLRADHLRYINPTPYKVSVSEKLYDFIHKLWLEEAPVGEIV